MPFPEIADAPLRPEIDLNYRVWGPGTMIQLAKVPWSADYRDVVRFAGGQGALNDYLAQQNGPKIENSGYAKVHEPIELDLSFTTAQNYNYVRVFNPGNAFMAGKSYYYFILDSTFIAGNNTMLIVQLDVWQTYGYGIKFGRCFIEQGHIGIANVNNFSGYGRNFLTVPEGLDVGGEYMIDSIYSRSIGTARGLAGQDERFEILVQTTIDFSAELGDFEDPKMVVTSGNLAENLPNGTDTYIFYGLATFKLFLEHYKDKPHAIAGIISITAIPRANYGIKTETVNLGPGNLAAVKRLTSGSLTNVQTSLAPNWRTEIGIPERYQHLNKFRTYPYTVLELTANTGTPLLLKPESWQDPNARVNEIPHFASASPRVMFSPHQYNAGKEAIKTDAYGVVRDGGEFLDMATGIFNLPTFMIANDGAKLYLANNRNSLAFQNRSADWAQTRAQAGNQLGYDQATAGMNTAAESTRIGVNQSIAGVGIDNDTAVMSTGLNALGALAQGVSQGPMGVLGGASSAAMQGAHTAIGMHNRNSHLANNTGAALAQNANAMGNAGYMRDSNKAYADMVSQGDYQNTIAGIQAKVQDAMLTQPSTAGQVGGDAFLLARYQWGYDLKVRLLDPAAMVAVGEYWLRYGYRVNRFGRMPESLKVMDKFTYWKLKETYITDSDCPESFKQTIRGIFEKGVTVWSDPNDLGRIDTADNVPLPGVFL